MKTKKMVKIEYIKTPVATLNKVNRWNLCAVIGKVFYHSGLTDDELDRLLEKFHDDYIINCRRPESIC